MSDLLSVQAPAKLNLFLHIVGQREDGYHLLQSVFQLIDLQDTVILKGLSDKKITRVNPINDLDPESDLVVKAARLLQETYGIDQGVEIDLIKRIPMGAGLGGGSSDAASTLLGLNALWNTQLNLNELANIGLKLGADVPFFIHGQNAFVEGIGELITPVNLPQTDFLLIYPGLGIPTADIFKSPGLTRNHARITISDLAEHLFDGKVFNNDLELIATQKHSEVKLAIDWLATHIPGGSPRMSGSGSTVFSPIPDGTEIDQLLVEIPKKWTYFVVRGLNQHPSYNLIPSH
jgi:4-diphosphocytidyl-2-C-methyl-D-erythritol kinase